MNENDPLIKDQPIMTPEQTSAALLELTQRFNSFQQSYNSKNYGKKVREDGEVVMAKGRQLVGGNNDILVLDGSDPTYRMWAGHRTAASAPFRVTKEGSVYIGGVPARKTYTGVYTTAGGVVESGWGDASSFAVSSPASGKITITHNLGLGADGYAVFLTVRHASATKHITLLDRSTNSFTVYMTDASNAAELNDFCFQLVVK